MKKIILVLLSVLCLTGCFKRDSMEDIKDENRNKIDED